MFFSQERAHFVRAAELNQEPPKGKPYSVPIPGTQKDGRSPVYRAWNTQEELVKTLDPKVRHNILFFFSLPFLFLVSATVNDTRSPPHTRFSSPQRTTPPSPIVSDGALMIR